MGNSETDMRNRHWSRSLGVDLFFDVETDNDFGLKEEKQ